MYEKAHEAILDRDESCKLAREHLNSQIAFLSELVNYGTNLIIRTLGHGDEDIDKLIVCGGLLKHVVSMMDAAVVLLESGHSTTAFLQARSCFEASLYIELILKKEPTHAARTYLVGEYRRRRAFAMNVLNESDSPGSFNAKFASIGMDTRNLDPQVKMLAKQQIADVNEALKRPPLDRIDQIYASRSRKNREPAWYQCLGLESLYQVAKRLDRIPDYELWYSHGSSITHADSLAQQVSIQDGKGVLKPVRNLEEAHLIYEAISQIALRSYRIILRHYRPLELPAFQQKYLEDWRAAFWSSQKITYLFQ